MLCFVLVMQSFIMNSHKVFIHIHQGCFADTGAIVRLPQCQWSKPDGYGKISQCITTTKHSKAKTVCIFPGIYCTLCEGSPPLKKPVVWRFDYDSVDSKNTLLNKQYSPVAQRVMALMLCHSNASLRGDLNHPPVCLSIVDVLTKMWAVL